MSHARYAVILAGGKGERFWPLSTQRRPKQLLSLVGGKPLVTLAVDRLAGVVPSEQILIITGADIAAALAATVPALAPEQIVAEPFGRDTAPACALALALVEARDPEASFCILTADQVMADVPGFQRALTRAFERAEAGEALVTIGIRPTAPSTGFGYIEADAAPLCAAADGAPAVRRAVRFVEKPDEPTARAYVAGGRHFWNSGMFFWRVATLRHALHRHQPELLALADRLWLAATGGGEPFDAVLRREYEATRKISIDYALMERADDIEMVEGDFGWDDVGSWTALANHIPADPAGNVVLGECRTLNATDNIVYSGDRLTALVGVDNLVVVQAEGVTLVCRRDRVQDIKALVTALRADGRHVALL